MEILIKDLRAFHGRLWLITATAAVQLFIVRNDTREIGIRLALGAQRQDVFKMIISQGLVLVLLDVGIGCAGALGPTRLLAGLLYGVSPTDVETFVAVSLLLTVVALLACYIPARRATKVDPLLALRYE
ncbi:MAG: FtsX-like permease family protein [Pyrinomonadaceae bacterium]